jgi:hypothetical protein
MSTIHTQLFKNKPLLAPFPFYKAFSAHTAVPVVLGQELKIPCSAPVNLLLHAIEARVFINFVFRPCEVKYISKDSECAHQTPYTTTSDWYFYRAHPLLCCRLHNSSVSLIRMRSIFPSISRFSVAAFALFPRKILCVFYCPANLHMHSLTGNETFHKKRPAAIILIPFFGRIIKF